MSPTQTALKKNFAQLADILKQPAKISTGSLPTSAMIKFAMPANSTSINISSSNSSTLSQSKISVVSPTILMSPQMSPKSQIATTAEQRQVRLPGNLHALLAASGSRTAVTNGNGMKFLLVNAADQRGPITTANFTSTIPLTGTSRLNAVTHQSNVNIVQNATQIQPQHKQQLPQQQQQQQQQQKQQHQKQQQQQQKTPKSHTASQQQKTSLSKSKEVKRVEIRQEYRDQLKKRDLLGIKTALQKMIKLQEDANEIQTERVAIDRERLQYERSMGDRFLNIIEQNQKIQQQLQQQMLQQQQLIQQVQLPQPQHIQLQQRSNTSPQVFTTNSGQATVTPNGQIMLPPKLLITTMVPTSAAQAVAVSNSKVLTATSFTNLASTSNSDLQLVVPKEEPQN